MASPFEDNISKYLRANSLFGGDMSPRRMNPNMSPPNISDGYNKYNEDMLPEFDAVSRYNELYKPETSASTRLNRMLESIPQRNNPGWLRKIAAVAASAGAPENVDRILYSPYQTQLQDWQTQLAPTLKAAELEREGNVNLRNVANQIVSQERQASNLERQYRRDQVLAQQGDRRLGATEGRYSTLQSQGDRRLDLQEDALELQQELANGGSIEVDDYGNARLLTRRGEQKPIKGNYLSEEAKAQLRVKFPSGGGQRNRTELETIQDPDDPSKSMLVIIDRDTNTYTRVRPGSASVIQPSVGDVEPEVETETEVEEEQPVRPPNVRESTATAELGKARQIQNKANQAAAAYPDLAKHIKFNRNGEFLRIDTPGGALDFFGITQDKYQTLYKAIYGDLGAPTDKPGTGIKPPTNRPGATTTPVKRADGKTFVKRKSDGRLGWVTNPDLKIYDLAQPPAQGGQ